MWSICGLVKVLITSDGFFGFLSAKMKAAELREMSDEQLELTAVEAAETLFRLRLQSQTDRVDVPTQNRKNRRLIARVKTIQTERAKSSAGK